jgi:PAS domain S-box-containing protein
MEHLLLIISIILQVGLGSYILFQNPRSRMNQFLAGSMLVYSSVSFVGLLRLVTTQQAIAAHLVVLNVITVYVWSMMFVELSIVIIFVPLSAKHPFWFFYLPVGIGLLGTIAVFAFYAGLPDQAQVATLIPGTDIYFTNDPMFPPSKWGLVYGMIWMGVALAWLLYVIIRRKGLERQPAAVLGASILVSGILGLAGMRFLSGSFRVSIPTFSSAVLSVAFGYVILRYRLFSAQDVATELVLNNLRDGMLVLRDDLFVVNCNQRAADLMGVARQSALNKRIDVVLSSSVFPKAVWSSLWSALQKGLSAVDEARYTLEGTDRIVVNEVTPIRDALEHVRGYVWMIRDVTELRHSQEETGTRNKELHAALGELESVTEAQGKLLETIRGLSAPAVPVMEGIIVVPLSGQIDSERAVRIMDSLLTGINDYEAKIAIMDITGVPVVDTVVAQYLIQAARAASLMGCRPFLVGIRPEIAQVIVELGIDMGGLTTFSDLQSGVEYALRMLGIELTKTTVTHGGLAVR